MKRQRTGIPPRPSQAQDAVYIDLKKPKFTFRMNGCIYQVYADGTCEASGLLWGRIFGIGPLSVEDTLTTVADKVANKDQYMKENFVTF